MEVFELLNEDQYVMSYDRVDITEVTGDFEMMDDVIEEAESHPLHKHIRTYYNTKFFKYDELQIVIDSILNDWMNKPEKNKTCKLTNYTPSDLPEQLRSFLNEHHKIKLVGDRIFPVVAKKKTTDPTKLFKDDLYILSAWMMWYTKQTFDFKFDVSYLNRQQSQVGVIKMFKNFGVDFDALVVYSNVEENKKDVDFWVKETPINETAEFKEYLQTIVDFT